MINSSIINLVLQSILGQKQPLGENYTSPNRAYICLGSEVGVSAQGIITSFTEPGSTSGYKRYLIGAYQYNSSEVGNIANKCKIDNGKAYNDETLYFDEALENWPTIQYFGIASSETSLPIAYGFIVDEEGHRTSLDVHTGQVPIIRTEQLQLSIEDQENIPFESYTSDIYFYDPSEPTPEVPQLIYKADLKTTNIVERSGTVVYHQVLITGIQKMAESTVVLKEGQLVFIPNLPAVIDLDTKVPLYNVNLGQITASIQVKSIEESGE